MSSELQFNTVPPAHAPAPLHDSPYVHRFPSSHDVPLEYVTVQLDVPVRVDTLLASRYNEGWPALSPDGRWLAYASDESGRNEVYLRAWPGMGNKLQVSQNGGGEPMWSRDGRELFYRSGGGPEPRMVAAVVEAGPMLRIRSRQELFSVASYEFATPHPTTTLGSRPNTPPLVTAQIFGKPVTLKRMLPVSP